MKIKPENGYILVEPVEEKVKKGGIILPDTATKERSELGKVIAVGEGYWSNGIFIKPTVKKGDTVLFGKYDAKIVKVGEKDCYFIEAKDILARIENFTIR